MEQIVAFIKANPTVVLGMFVIIMVSLSIGKAAVTGVKAELQYRKKWDSEYSKTFDKWGN